MPKPNIHTPEEECGYGPACWLWDYLRRSGASGFLLPLSGGADSASVATIVRIMCDFVADAVKQGDEVVVKDIQRILNIPTSTSSTINDRNAIESEVLNGDKICNYILNI